jgi:cholest-5-ene-3beta,7alpha-diol 3beta-dehydrogenase
MKRVLITGASGTVGREVLKQLLASPDACEITVFVLETRKSKSFYKKFNSTVNIIYGDISNKNDVCKACRNIDIVIHLAAIIPPEADKYPELAEAVNLSGTKNLIECIEEQSPDAFLIYSSSISVYGDRNSNPWIKTSDPLIPSDRDEYARTKIAAEKIITNSKIRWTIFRLTAIMGMDNHKPSELMFHMPLNSHLEIATPGDTGRAFVNSIGHLDELNRKIYNLSGGEKCRIFYRDFLSRSFEIFGLGNLDFKEDSFATRNFHCGYYADGEILDDILSFRRETIDDYFESMKNHISPFRRMITMIFRKIIKRNLQKRSEPLVAVDNDNKTDIQHYFK